MQKDKKKRFIFGLAILNIIPLNGEASLKEQSDVTLWSGTSAQPLSLSSKALRAAAAACSLAVNAQRLHFQLFSFSSVIGCTPNLVWFTPGKKRCLYVIEQSNYCRRS